MARGRWNSLRPSITSVPPLFPRPPATLLRGYRRPLGGFKELIGVRPGRLAGTYRFAATAFAINPAKPFDGATSPLEQG
jgi:hypothetical protein